MKRSALGRGLGALIPTDGVQREQAGVLFCSTEDIRPNPDQPRSAFDQEGLEALAETVRRHGILQPLLVSKKEAGYELIAGERRLRAAKLAGLDKVPVIVIDIEAGDRLEISLLENLQRENLNPVEEARAYRALLDRFGCTQDDLAKKLGKDRSSLANSLRLLNLPNEIQEDLASGVLSPGHGRALLALGSEALQKKAKRCIETKKFTVRETEAYIKRLQDETRAKPRGAHGGHEPELDHVQDELCKYYGTRVKIVKRGQGGDIQIRFASMDDLDRLYTQLIR